MFRDRIVKKLPEIRELKFSSPVFPFIAQTLQNSKNARILDLDAARPGKSRFFRDLNCNPLQADVAYNLCRLQRERNEPEEVFQIRLRRVFSELIQIPDMEKVDVVFCWDVLNFIKPEVFLQFSHFLTQFCHNNTYIHAYMYVHELIPDSPSEFEIEGDSTIIMRGSENYKKGYGYTPMAFRDLMPRFSTFKSMLLKSGVQEYVFKFGFY